MTPTLIDLAFDAELDAYDARRAAELAAPRRRGVILAGLALAVSAAAALSAFALLTPAGVPQPVADAPEPTAVVATAPAPDPAAGVGERPGLSLAADAALALPEPAPVPAEQPQAAPESASSSSASAVSASFFSCGWGGQALIDSCSGGAWFTGYSAPIPPTFAIHWSHGGYNAPLDAGATITIDGTAYRTLGTTAVLSQTRDTTDAIPLGYDAYLQTCIGGSSERMAFVALERI